MKNKKAIKVLVVVMVLALSIGMFAGCGTQEAAATSGTLVVKVNPEFEVSYDEKGNVVEVLPMNEDAGKLMEQVNDYGGKPAREVIADLIALMDKEGYIEKEVKGEGKNINIEVKYGSVMPSEDFLDDIVLNIKVLFDDKKVTGKVVVSGESNYGFSSYDVSDYGNTDYKAIKSKIDKAVAGGSSYTDYGNTDYDGYNSDYGANTDYDGANTDYTSNYGNSDYSTGSSSTNKKPTTGTTNKSDYGNSGYDKSDYDSNSGYSDYDD